MKIPVFLQFMLASERTNLSRWTSVAHSGISLCALCYLALTACTRSPGNDEGRVAKPDFDRENRIAESVRKTLWEGEIISLSPRPSTPENTIVGADRDFIAVHTPAERDSRRGSVALLLHGRGRSPIRPYPNDAIRVRLAAEDVASLAIQLPVLVANRPYRDYFPLLPLARLRIGAALEWLQKRYPEKSLHLIAHSCGIHMAMNYIHHRGDQALTSFVGLSMYNFTPPDYRPKAPYPIARMNVPILDIIPEHAGAPVLDSAWHRIASARSGGVPYRQWLAFDTDSGYQQRPDEWTARIISFIDEVEGRRISR